MVIQTVNVVAGFVLAAPKLKSFGGAEHITALEGRLNAFRGWIGVGTLALGIAALLERMMIVQLSIPSFGSSYPQALVAIAMGLILTENLFAKYPQFQGHIGRLKDHAEWIGLAGVAIGLGSILFGCPLCVY